MMRHQLLSLAALGALASCQAPVNDAGAPVVPPQFEVDARKSEKILTLDGGKDALGPVERASLAAFLAESGSGRPDAVHLTVSGDGNTRERVVQAAIEDGIDPAKIERRVGEGHQVRVVAVRFRAVLPDCPNTEHLTISGFDNDHNSNFGCALRNGLAAQVADPRDLVRGESGGMTESAVASAAIERLRDDKVKDIDRTATSTAAGGSK